MRRTTVGLSLFFLLPAASAYGFACITFNGQGDCIRWATGQATLRSFLGAPPGPLFNGTPSWDQNAIDAANDWNVVGAAFHFTVDAGGQFFDPCGSGGGHACPNTGPAGDNPIFFTGNICGVPFGPDIIEQTNTCYTAAGAVVNAVVFVNVNVRWNAYDGRLVAPVNDIRRVLLHEFGHVLGLAHPDDNGQQVPAIMNSHESDIDRLQPDDIRGILSLYPSGGGSTGSASSSPNQGCQIGRAPVSTNGWMVLLPGVLGMMRWRQRASKPHVLI